MIRKVNRFHGHGSLRYLKNNADDKRSRFFAIKYVENKMRKNSRFSVIISKKIVKSAVSRNRIRRRLFEIIRLNLKNIKPGTDMVIIVFSADLKDINYDEINEVFLKLLKDAGLLLLDE